MKFNTFIFISLIAIGTYFLRFLPLKASLQKAYEKENKKDMWSEILEISGISIIASLLVSSVSVPETGDALFHIINIFLSSLIVIGTCLLWKNPGVSVVAGVLTFGIISFMIM